MQLTIKHKRGVAAVTGVQDSHLWDVVPLSDLDLDRLLPCEQPRMGCASLNRFDKDDLGELHLRVEVPGQRCLYLPIRAVLKRRRGVLGSNFAQQLSRLKDLGRLPRFVFADFIQRPPTSISAEETAVFLNDIVHASVLDLDLDGELIREMAQEGRFLIYYSWFQLALDTSWEVVDLLAEKFGLYQTAQATLPHYTWHPEPLEEWILGRMDLKGKALALEYRPEIVDATVWMEHDGDASGIYGQNSHEQFVQENPDIAAHTRDARNFYFEMEPTERAQWLMYEEDSVFNQPLPEAVVSQVDLDSKACRELRYELLTSLFHDVYEWCKARQRWEFTKHWWYEDGNHGRAPKYAFAIDLQGLKQQQPRVVRSRANVYGRYGLLRPTAEPAFHGPGLRCQISDRHENLEPAEIINTMYRRIFGVRKGWQKRRESLLASVAKLKNSEKLQVRRRAAGYQALANRMGTFLTQEHLHGIRLLTEWLYTRFQVPAKLRRPTKEKHPVAENRINDLAEEMRKVQAKIELVEHELVLDHTSQQTALLHQNLQRLLRQAKGLNQRQVRLAAELAATPELAKHLERLRIEGDCLEVQELEALADALEEDVRRLLDPSHRDFDCDLPMAKLIYGKAGLHRRLQDLQKRLQESPQPQRTQRLADMLRELQLRYELYETRSECFLEDLPPRQRRELGFEVEYED